MGMQISEVAIENSAEIYLIKLEIELPYNPAIPLYSIYSKDISMLCQKDTCQVYSRTVHNSQALVSTTMSIIRQMDKGKVVHIHNAKFFSYKKKMTFYHLQ